MMTSTTLKEKTFMLLLAVTTFFVFNAALPTDIMECRNLITAHEMATDGNWLVPTMNGELRLEKPPLPTWIAGAIDCIAPGSLAAQRVAPGLAGCLWTFFLYLTARWLTKRRRYAFIATVVFLTSYHIVQMGRTATWDIYCHAFMMGAIYYMLRGLGGSASNRWRWLPLAGLMMGLSFLSKGPVSFYALLLPALLAAVQLTQLHTRGKWDAVVVMVVVCLVVSSWWYVYLLLFHSDATGAVIGKESGSWLNHNVRPWYYYWRYFAETGAWALIVLASLAVGYWRRHLRHPRTYAFAVAWMLLVLLMLSLMPEKKIRYLLPIMAPCALVTACLLEHFINGRDRLSVLTFRTTAIVVSIIAAAAPVAVFVLHLTGTMQAVVFAALMWLTAALLIHSLLRFKPMELVYGVGLVFMLVECFVLEGVGQMFGNPDKHSMRLVRNERQLDSVPFCYPSDEPLRIELVYEAGRKILPVSRDSIATRLSEGPMVLVSAGYAAEELDSRTLQLVDTVAIGIYDDNKHPKNNKHYTPDFVRHVTLLKSKQTK